MSQGCADLRRSWGWGLLARRVLSSVKMTDVVWDEREGWLLVAARAALVAGLWLLLLLMEEKALEMEEELLEGEVEIASFPWDCSHSRRSRRWTRCRDLRGNKHSEPIHCVPQDTAAQWLSNPASPCTTASLSVLLMHLWLRLLFLEGSILINGALTWFCLSSTADEGLQMTSPASLCMM